MEIAGRIVALERLPDRHRPIDVLLIPQAVDQHRRHRDRIRRQHLVHRLILPERIVRRVRGDLALEADLIETALLREGARRTGGEVKIVIVAIARPRSDESRAGTESVSTCRSRWAPHLYTKATLS